MEIYSISQVGGQVRVSTLIACSCYYRNGSFMYGSASTNTAEMFTVSSKANKLTAFGCNTLAFLVGYNKHRAGAGCFSMCQDDQSVDRSGQCSGMGCCQTSIAPNLTTFRTIFDGRFNNSEVRDFNPCSYAFVAEQDWFRFEPSYTKDNKLLDKFMHGVPGVLDWVAGSEPCEEAVKNTSSYACVSHNSQCMKSPNATGYLRRWRWICRQPVPVRWVPRSAALWNSLSSFKFTSNYLFIDIQFSYTLVLYDACRYQ
jgi:hypothetical protein